MQQKSIIRESMGVNGEAKYFNLMLLRRQRRIYNKMINI